MFTGLIEDLGTVRELRKDTDRVRITVATRIPMIELTIGESIAVNGICLTLVSFGGGTFCADVSPETLKRTTLTELTPGCSVNLERALRLSGRLGGHLVSGHVDSVATIIERIQDGNAVRFTFRLSTAVNRYVAEKGSVAVDGISLTTFGVTEDSFSAAIIPHTLAMTTLKDKRIGSKVNIETDIIGKYVERLLRGADEDSGKEPLDFEFLARHGFF
jgi:riboflavin synthase